MNRSWWFRFVFLLILVVISVVSVIPTVFDHDEESKFPVKTKINLGLDLQGGLYMILGIDFNRAYKDEIRGWAKKIESRLKDENIAVSLGDIDLSDVEDPKHSLVIVDPNKLAEAERIVKEYFRGVLRLTGETKDELTYGLLGSWKTYIQENSVSKSIEVIRNRIDEFGVTEPEIISQGNDRIIIQLPGVKDIDRAKSLIGKTAKLEFKIVNDT
ncbi:MAG: hypothetical protein KAQ98_12745, partial [Bacteriovoracaceae bacterium]|nr:hypothetical protein [Bacteriovoracaceae bacterium]